MVRDTEVLLLVHGSKHPDYGVACEAFLDTWNRSSGTHARFCFLEQCEPLLEDVLNAVAAHSRSVAILPLLLNAGMHLRQDIPDRLAAFKQHHPEIELYLAGGLTDVGVVAEALHGRATEIQADMSSIILLTHGSRQSDTWKNATRVADMLARQSGAKVDVAFLGHGGQPFKDALAQRVDKDAVVIAPHFLFPGLWQRQVRTDMDAFRRANPATELMLAKPLEAHPALLRLLRQQLDTAFNCSTTGDS